MHYFTNRVIESGLLEQSKYLVLCGIASDAIQFKAEHIFGRKVPNSVICFAKYAQNAIPLKTVFNTIFNPVTMSAANCTCEISAATQQFFYPFDEIPTGWKTICKFTFLSNRPKLLDTLPVVDDWFDNQSIVLVVSSLEFWLEFKDLMKS